MTKLNLEGILMNARDRILDFPGGPALKKLILRVPSGGKGRFVLIGLLVATIATIYVAKAEKTDFVRISKPAVLTFDELVQLSRTLARTLIEVTPEDMVSHHPW